MLILDSSFLIDFHNQQDVHHPAASRVMEDLLGGKHGQAREVEFLPCSDLFAQTLETFSSQKKADLSFTDAALVTIAKRQGGIPIATFDRDFRSIEGISVVP